MDKKSLGQCGEDIAVEYFHRRGYRIVERNFVARVHLGKQIGELDIVAKKGSNFIFIEVKTGTEGGVAPEMHVTPWKARRLIRAARLWLAKQKKSDAAWQIDVLAVRAKPDGIFDVAHIEQAIGEDGI